MASPETPEPQQDAAAGLAALLGGIADHLAGLDARRQADQGGESDGR